MTRRTSPLTVVTRVMLFALLAVFAYDAARYGLAVHRSWSACRDAEDAIFAPLSQNPSAKQAAFVAATEAGSRRGTVLSAFDVTSGEGSHGTVVNVELTMSSTVGPTIVLDPIGQAMGLDPEDTSIARWSVDEHLTVMR